MKRINFFALLIISELLLFSSNALPAESGSVNILSPVDGASLLSTRENKLTYTLQLGPEGNHLHVYIDDQKPIIVRNVTGCPCSIDLPVLPSGKHVIVVKEARSDHSLTGVQSMITVNASN